MAGQVTVSVPGLSSTVSQVKSGALKALAKRANISMD
jgi:tripartite-type tricarboxylate transporter receptor subunit TctC